MMIRVVLAIVLACASVVLFAQAALNDFARGVEIRTEGPGSIFRVVLPEDVYATSTRSDLSDLRVFNAAGDLVPHTLREAPLPPASDAAPIDVPSFPIHDRADSGGALTQVRIGERGAVLEVKRDPGEGQVISSYLVDASALEMPIDRMSLEVASAESNSFLARVKVERSNDLIQWQTVVPAAAIARMQHGTYVLTQSDIDLPPLQSRYLRISWPQELAAATLTSVRVRPQTFRPVAEIRWSSLEGQAETSGTVVYDARARLPIQQIDVEFADPTDAASVIVRSRPDTSSEWRQVHSGLFYSLTESGTKLRSSSARVPSSADRYWLVETTRDGGWRRDRLPRLKLGWHPHELLFLARGAGPYTLAYGSSRVGPTDAPVDAVLASLRSNGGTDRAQIATLGAPRDVGGANALRPVRPIRRIVLWAVLIAAVLALAGLAWRVFKEPSRPSTAA